MNEWFHPWRILCIAPRPVPHTPHIFIQCGSTGLWQDALTLRTSKISENVPLPACDALIAFTHSYPAINIISPPQPISLHHLCCTETLPRISGWFSFYLLGQGQQGGWLKVVQIFSLSRDEELEDHRMCFSIQFHHPCSSWKFLLDSGNSLLVLALARVKSSYPFLGFVRFSGKLGEKCSGGRGLSSNHILLSNGTSSLPLFQNV